jgi:hypothetical protein
MPEKKFGFSDIKKKILAEFETNSKYKKQNGLDLYYINISEQPSLPAAIKGYKNKTIDFKKENGDKNFFVYFIMDGIGLEKITPVMIAYTKKAAQLNTVSTDEGQEEVKADENRSSGSSAKEDDSKSIVFDINDFYSLKTNDLFAYSEFCKYLEGHNDETKLSDPYQGNKYTEVFQSDKKDESVISYGIVHRNNEDFIKYLQTVDQRKFPDSSDSKASKSILSFITPKYIDFSLSKQSFSLKGLNTFSSDGLGGVGFINSFEDPVLNYLPFEAPYFSSGLSMFVKLTDNVEKLKDDFFMELNIMGRFPFKSAENRKYFPVFGVDKPLLNVTPGITFEAHLSKNLIKPFFQNFPFLNFYFSTGSESYSSPNVKFKDSDTTTSAYFSKTQWQTTFSFFWNSDIEEASRFKIELGVGGNSFQTVRYYKDSLMLGNSDRIVQPLVALEFNIYQKKKPVMGFMSKCFDSRMTLGFWMKLFEISKNVNVRFEAKCIMEPFLRSTRNWETKSGYFTQIRLRYGFKEG